MRLRFRLFVNLGALLLLLSSIKPASANHRFSEDFPVSKAPRSRVVFEHLTIEDGLSQNAGLALLQDHQGFVWIGTQDGLNRYDGYEFKTFKHDPDDSNSISHNSIIALHEDTDGFLWVGTWGGGLNRHDPETNIFTRYSSNPEDQYSISDVTIPALAEDQDGNLWIGTTSGLDLFVHESGEITNFSDDSDNLATISGKAIGALFLDGEQNLWIGTGAYGIPGAGLYLLDGNSREARHVALGCTSATNISSIVQDKNGSLWIGHGGYSLPGGGLTRFDPATQDCTHYGGDPAETDGLGEANIIRMILDSDGWLWITTDEDGLYRMDIAAPGEFHSFLNVLGDESSLSSDNTYAIIQDHSGVLWIGTLNSGINKLKPRTLQLGLYRNNPVDPTSLGSDKVGAFAEDKIGNIWVGTWGAGLDRFNPYTGRFTHFRHAPEDPNSVSDDTIMTLAPNDSGGLWIGTMGGGLDYFDIRKNTFRHYRNNPSDPGSLVNNNIPIIHLDGQGNLWIGTLGGLDRFDPATGNFTHYQPDPENPNSLSHPAIVGLFADRDNILWVGTWGGGLNRLDLNDPSSFDPARAQFTHYRADPADSASLSEDSVWVIHQSEESGMLWLGTMGGLNRFDPQAGVFKSYSEKDGLRNATILGILEDSEGYLWITTNNGLAKFNPHTETFHIFDSSDGLQGNEFSSNAYLESSAGLFFFGGIHGFNEFDPLKIQPNPVPPEIVITDFTIFNESVKTDLSGADPIKLKHSQDFIAFEFAAIDYHAPQKNQYAYMLEGFDQDWVEAGTRRYASYTNLPGGEYVFHVKGSNGDGVWNDTGVSIPIIVTPPFWQTWWFIGSAILVIAGVIAMGFQSRVRTVQKNARKLETIVEQRTVELRDANSQLEMEIEQRKQAEEALARRAAEELEQSEARFRTMYETSAVGIGMMGIDGKVIGANPALCQMFGYSCEELVGQTSALVTHPDDLSNSTQHLQDLLAGKYNHYTDERRYLRKNGETIWAQITMSLVRDSQGRPLYIVGMLTDITEKKRTLEDLRSSQARFQAVFENAGVGIGLIGLDRRPIEVNAAFEKMTGYSAKELYQTTGIELGYSEDAEIGLPEFQDVLAGKLDSYQIEKRYIRKNGQVYWVRLNNSIVRDADGKPLYLVILVEDINEQKLTLDDLRRSQARFQAVFENAAVGIAVMGLDRQPIAINPVTEQIIGYSLEEMKGVNPRDLAIPEDRNSDNEMFPELITGKRNSYVMERRYRRKNGEIFWARINYSLVRDLDSNPEYLVGMIEDIDDQKRASERLAAQEAEHRRILEQRIAERTEELNKANELLQQKAAQEAVTAERTRLARDLHDAVTQTLFSATLIADVLPDIWSMNEEEGLRRLEELRQLTRGALAEMRTLLVELRPNALVEVPLPTLLRQLSEALTGRARIDIQFSFEGERALPPDVQVAFYRIAQEGLNNVVKHSKASQAAVMLRLGEQVRLSITDDGAGFDPETVTADHLGLKIMCERSEAIRAKFNLYSEPGEGTQVTVTWQDKEII